jgi:hypothetical protein
MIALLNKARSFYHGVTYLLRGIRLPDYWPQLVSNLLDAFLFVVLFPLDKYLPLEKKETYGTTLTMPNGFGLFLCASKLAK